MRRRRRTGPLGVAARQGALRTPLRAHTVKAHAEPSTVMLPVCVTGANRRKGEREGAVVILLWGPNGPVWRHTSCLPRCPRMLPAYRGADRDLVLSFA